MKVRQEQEKKERKIKIDEKRVYKKVPFWLTGIMVLILVIMCFILMNWVKDKTQEYKSVEAFVRYSMGSEFVYDTGFVLSREEDITYIGKTDKLESDGTPIIYKDQYKYLLPVSMGYLNPNSEVGAKRVNYFSDVAYDIEQHKATISYSDKLVDVDAGFLYDGDGTFIFMEEVELTIGTMHYVLSPMSYVRVFFGDSVELLDIQKDEYKYIVIEEDDTVHATANTGYSINLATNVMTIENAPRILFSNIEAMGVLE
jgi:hypothetical protein